MTTKAEIYHQTRAGIYDLAQELIELWLNGNQSYVVGEIAHSDNPKVAIALAALVAEGLDSDDRDTFSYFLVNTAIADNEASVYRPEDLK